jgi:hypothetical protein
LSDAAALAFADSSMNGNPVYPTVLKASMFRDNIIPECGSSGISFSAGSGYDPLNGLASCPSNINLHSR